MATISVLYIQSEKPYFDKHYFEARDESRTWQPMTSDEVSA